MESPKKWYVFVNKAEEYGSFVLSLDDQELIVVDKLLTEQGNLVAGGGWCGFLWREQCAYETKEAAIDAAIEAV